MPWSYTTTMNANNAFILEWKSQKYEIKELSRRYGVSRTTAYKWIGRYEEVGEQGLMERSRAQRNAANKTSHEVEQAIVQTRLKHPSWGAKKLIWRLERQQPELGKC